MEQMEEKIIDRQDTAEEGTEPVVQLSSDDILNFAPGVEDKGYSPSQVDEFLDKIIWDYDAYAQQVAELKSRLQEKEEAVVVLQQQISRLKEELDAARDELEAARKEAEETRRAEPEVSALSGGAQVDMLKRIARLEAAVFGGRRI